MGEFSIMHWLVVAAIVILVFGAKRLPEMGAAMGKGIREFKRNISDVDRQIQEPERDARADRLNAGEPIRRDDDKTSEPKRLLN